MLLFVYPKQFANGYLLWSLFHGTINEWLIDVLDVCMSLFLAKSCIKECIPHPKWEVSYIVVYDNHIHNA
jgi:hypothetical protein